MPEFCDRIVGASALNVRWTIAGNVSNNPASSWLSFEVGMKVRESRHGGRNSCPWPRRKWLNPAWVIVLVLAGVATVAHAALPATVLAQPRTKDLYSQITHADYRLTIILPRDYDKSSARYPVLYLMDGNWLAPFAQVVGYRLTVMNRDIPGLILVGVDYPGASGRSLDYATVGTAQWTVPADRGVDNFMKVLRNEVIPYVDATYRTDPTDRGIGGHSLGGLASTYALYHASDLFKRFWLSSPSLSWDHQAAMAFPAAYAANHKDLEARVYADVGEIEAAEMRTLIMQLRDRTLALGYPGLSWQLQVENGHTHATVPIVALPDALLYLYGRPVVAVDLKRLAALVGHYRRPDGRIVTLTTDGHRLLISGVGGVSDPSPEPENIPMTAQSPDRFYINFIGCEIVFPAGQARPTKMDLTYRTEDKNQPAQVVAERLGVADPVRKH
jgi:uncharacterized protein